MSNTILPARTVDLNLLPEAVRWQYAPSHEGGYDLRYITRNDSANYLEHVALFGSGKIQWAEGPTVVASSYVSPEDQRSRDAQAAFEEALRAGEQRIEDQRRADLKARHEREAKALEAAIAGPGAALEAERQKILASIQTAG